jgi:hypothetical protein
MRARVSNRAYASRSSSIMLTVERTRKIDPFRAFEASEVCTAIVGSATRNRSKQVLWISCTSGRHLPGLRLGDYRVLQAYSSRMT